MSPQEHMLLLLKKQQTAALIDGYGLHVAKVAEQSRDLALIAWALLSNNDEEKRRNLLIEIARQVSDATNLMIRLRNKQ